MRGPRLAPHAIVVHVSNERRRATYEDLCKVPDHLVAEIIDGELFTSPRPALPHALASSMIGFALIGPSVALPRALRLLAAGGSWTSRSCTSGRTSSFPTSRAGDASGSRPYPTRRRCRCPRTGPARSSLPPRVHSTAAARCRCTLASGSGISGSWTRARARSRSTASRAGAGSWRARMPGAWRCVPSRSTRSSSTSAAGGAIRSAGPQSDICVRVRSEISAGAPVLLDERFAPARPHPRCAHGSRLAREGAMLGRVAF